MSDRAPLFRVREAELSALLTANLNSFALDFVARTAVGGTDLSFFIIKQLPLLPPEAFERLEATGTSPKARINQAAKRSRTWS